MAVTWGLQRITAPRSRCSKIHCSKIYGGTNDDNANGDAGNDIIHGDSWIDPVTHNSEYSLPDPSTGFPGSAPGQ